MLHSIGCNKYPEYLHVFTWVYQNIDFESKEVIQRKVVKHLTRKERNTTIHLRMLSE